MITDDDRYLWLHGAIENLCRAQTEMTDTEASAKLGEAVHLIAEVGHGINPRSDTFRFNLRRPEITDVEAMALVRRAIARLLHDDPERVLSWEDLPALTESEKRRVDDAMKDVADALDRYASAACPNIDELWESLS